PIPNIVEEPQELVFGAYDPEGTLNDTTLSIEEVFLAWRLNDTSEITSALQKIRQKERMPLISLEPWSFNRNGMVKETLLTDIVEGKYDPTIQGICQTIGQENPQPVLLRWGQEMELTGQWEWAQGNPEGFIASYRKFVDVCRSTGATNIRFVWSPAGDPSLKKYWPGSAYFDYAGLTALEFEAWSLQKGAPRGLTFEELFDPRYNLVKDYGKPVIIAEFGADREQQEEWLKEASLAFANYPLLKGVVLFNAKSETAWDGGLTPDWRINAPWDPNLETKTK
ncbi:MAG: hypothetical protein Q8O75_02470, partial [bacterium]|nr:hypothetical protein [bacterium]